MRSLRLVPAALVIVAVAIGIPAAVASHTAGPATVTIAGSLQSEAGCPGDWQPDCANTHLAYDAADDVWQGSWAVPAGSYEYKAALNDSWSESYGLNGGGNNIPLTADGGPVKFYYDHTSHWITDNKRSVIATAAGSFQSELGCPGDWQPDCLRSWLQDVDADGTYTFSTTVLPPGGYEFKVALNETWDVSYGQGGGSSNVPFTVSVAGSTVSISWNSTTHVPTVTVTAPGGALRTPNNVEWAGVWHDSRATLYRTPGGAVAAGTAVKLRLRTFHDDVTNVKLRLYDVNASAQSLLPMTLAAGGVSCYDPGLTSETCDFWEVTLPNGAPNNLWYRFVVTDGTDIDYYADNTAALDGGAGSMTDEAVDNSFALMVYVPGFIAPAWAKDAVVYQIFPDRFDSGDKKNDPKTGDPRYDDPVLKLPWETLPEGFCRNYADAATSCPWRFDTTPPPSSPTKEQPRGRDYMGGDLKGIEKQLDYLRDLGITTIYLNPVFDAGSNHSYDTQDYTRIDPYFGSQKDWDKLVKEAKKKGIKVILDGVFNHMSSDSPFFDRYHRYSTVGACESLSSPYRGWFVFKTSNVPCGTADYEGWFGFDSIPVLNKSNPAVQRYFLTNPDAIAKRWLQDGAAGWRLDVSGDPSFPAGYWETFRSVIKGVNPNALSISETWQKDSTLLRMLRGDRLDTTMNYRLRDAVLGLLAPGPFDSKGFADSGRVISPSEFVSRLASVREDYPDAAYFSLMNLLDSHDTERLLWTLTPGAETRADKELNVANVAMGKEKLRLAALIQFTLAGAPTVYYGDEVGITGDDDPDDRRTMPWSGKSQDKKQLDFYEGLTKLREETTPLRNGDTRFLLADDTAGTVAYARIAGDEGAVVVFNRSDVNREVHVPVAGTLPNGTELKTGLKVGTVTFGSVVSAGEVVVTLGPRSGAVLVTKKADLTAPAAPAGLTAGEGNAKVALSWAPVSGAAGYNVYRSPLSGGGWVKVNASPVGGTAYDDTGLENGRTYYYVVRALDSVGNESASSNEVSALPHPEIGWSNLQWPPTLTHTISAVNRTDNVYGQVWIDGLTSAPGPTPGLRAQLGFGPDGSNPAGNASWTWIDASFNTQAGNNDEFKASLLPEVVGQFDYAYRYSVTGGRDWVYADLDGSPNGYSPGQAGALTVGSSGDTTAPLQPTGLRVVSASPAGIDLAWNAIVGDPSLYGYEVYRGSSPGSPTMLLAQVAAPAYTDTAVEEGKAYVYAVKAVDLSFNRSPLSDTVTATAEKRTVTLDFTVTVPASTDGTGRSVYIAGFLDRLDGNLPQWNPGGVVLTRADATHWRITFTGKEGVQIEYKYALGSWDYVEKDGACGEVANRQLTLAYGVTGTQTVNDTVVNWRNVAPCGN